MTPNEFITLFNQLWQQRIASEEDRNTIIEAYQGNATWTKFMLDTVNYTDGFLPAIGDRAGYLVGWEWYTLDCVYHDEHPNLIEGETYPACLKVIIEHENGEDVEREMYKLLMWRSPLKVLVFYDYPDHEKQNDVNKSAWLSGKFQYLGNMAHLVNDSCSGDYDCEYIFVVGSESEIGNLPNWRYYRLCQNNWVVEAIER